MGEHASQREDALLQAMEDALLQSMEGKDEALPPANVMIVGQETKKQQAQVTKKKVESKRQDVLPDSSGAADAATTSQAQPSSRMSRQLTTVLRHKAVAMGLDVAPDGYVLLDALLSLPCVRKTFAKEKAAVRKAGCAVKGTLSLQQVRGIVANCKKQRFSLKEERRDDGTVRVFLRANQGHSLPTDVIDETKLLVPIRLRGDGEEESKSKGAAAAAAAVTLSSPCARVPEYCCHGTMQAYWPSIRKEGIKRMSRHHVHFSTHPSGVRGRTDVVVHVDIVAAMGAGLRFFQSANGVVLTPGDERGTVPSKFFSKVERLVRDRRSGEVIRREPMEL